jgi:hypothetical protein
MCSQIIRAQGADAAACNLKTRIGTLWDTMFWGKPVRIRPTKTFEKDSNSLARTLKQAANAVQTSKLPKKDKDAALQALSKNVFQTRTLGEGQAKNSTFGDHRFGYREDAALC